MKVTDLDTAAKRYLRGSIEAYLEGKKNLNWITGIVKTNYISREILTEILSRLTTYGDRSRYLSLRKECEKMGLLM